MKKMRLVLVVCMLMHLQTQGSDQTQKLFDYLSLRNQNVNSSVVIEKIDHFIKAGADADGRSPQPLHLSPLMLAVANRQDKKVIEFLIKHGADVNARTRYDDSALNFALGSSNREMIETLVNLGAKVHARDLRHMLYDGVDISLLKFVLSHCDNLGERFDKHTLLHAMASRYHNVTRLLLNEKIDLHAKDLKDGSSVLHSACNTLNVRLFKADSDTEIDSTYEQDLKTLITELVKRGINVNVEDDHGTTPLHIVVKSSHVDLQETFIDLLVSLGADPLKKDHNGLSPLHYVAHAELPSYTSDILLSAIKKYKPEILELAEAELKEDNEVVKETALQKARIHTIIDYCIAGGINIFAVVGLVYAIKPCFKVKKS